MQKIRRQIKAKAILKDIENGLSNEQLREKYNLSEKGLESLLRKLYAAKAIRIGADSVILKTPAENLTDKFLQESAEKKSVHAISGNEEGREERPAITHGERECVSCGCALTGEHDECPACAGKRGHDDGMQPSTLDTDDGDQPETEVRGPFERADRKTVPGAGATVPDTRMILGSLGAMFLFFGTFTPVVKVPIVGGLNYFQIGTVARDAAIGGYVFMGIAVVAMVLVILRMYVGLWIPHLCSAGFLAYTFIEYRKKVYDLDYQLIEVRSRLHEGISTSPERLESAPDLGLFVEQFADQLPEHIGLDWGWLVLILGTMLLLSSAVLATKELFSE